MRIYNVVRTVQMDGDIVKHCKDDIPEEFYWDFYNKTVAGVISFKDMGEVDSYIAKDLIENTIPVITKVGLENVRRFNKFQEFLHTKLKDVADEDKLGVIIKFLQRWQNNDFSLKHTVKTEDFVLGDSVNHISVYYTNDEHADWYFTAKALTYDKHNNDDNLGGDFVKTLLFKELFDNFTIGYTVVAQDI